VWSGTASLRRRGPGAGDPVGERVREERDVARPPLSPLPRWRRWRCWCRRRDADGRVCPREGDGEREGDIDDAERRRLRRPRDAGREGEREGEGEGEGVGEGD
jgi:hypothetical protein